MEESAAYYAGTCRQATPKQGAGYIHSGYYREEGGRRSRRSSRDTDRECPCEALQIAAVALLSSLLQPSLLGPTAVAIAVAIAAAAVAAAVAAAAACGSNLFPTAPFPIPLSFYQCDQRKL